MKFTLSRKEAREDGIFGELLDEKGNFLFITLEHSYDLIPKLPAGEYKCTRFTSPHLGYEVFMVMDVPGHDHILLHIGNYNEDSDGCPLLGMQIGPKSNGGKMICDSKKAFNSFMEITKDHPEITLKVEDVCR